MTKCVKNRNMVFVFDLDKTIGYFTQVAIFMEGIEEFIKRKLKKKEIYKLFDLFPEMFRPDMMSIFKYLINLKKKLNLIYEKHTGQSLNVIETMMERDYFMSAD